MPCGSSVDFGSSKRLTQKHASHILELPSYDGTTLRIEFLVSRMDQEKSSEGRTGRKLPVCRLVLTPTGAIELLYQAQRMAAALEKAEAVKKVESEKVEGAPAS